MSSLFGAWTNPKPTEQMAKGLRDKGHIKSDKVEAAFRSVPRSAFVPAELEKKACEDSPIKQGIVHLSAPHMYAIVLEALDIQPGHSFLNIGSGTGYFNVLVGYMIGRVGVNRGIEISSPLVDFAREKTDTFLKNTSVGVCSPMFIAGNCFRLDTTDRKYDRVYCGAECSELQLRDFILKTIKIGGVAVVPCNKRLLKITNSSDDRFHQETITGVSYVSLVSLSEGDKKLPLLHFPADKGSFELAKKLVEKGNIKSRQVEVAFSSVPRAAFVPPELKGRAYDDSPLRQGSFHLSAPHMYAIVLEALDIQAGNSFLNIGSGTGYFSALAGCLIGKDGISHGIERVQELVQFARETSKKLKEETSGLYCKPHFIVGNCFRLDTTSRQYDRVYCGAACTEEQLNWFVTKLIARGGCAVVPCCDKLLKVIVDSSGKSKREVLGGVSYVPLVGMSKEELNMPRLSFPGDDQDLQVLTRQVERLRIELLEESNRRKALEDLQHDILDGSQDLVQEKDELEEEVERLRTELSSEREVREAAEQQQHQLRGQIEELQSVVEQKEELEEGMERLRTELSRERELREAAEHIQQQLRDEKNSLQSVLQQKDEHLVISEVIRFVNTEEVTRLRSQLAAAQNGNRNKEPDGKRSWELNREDIHLTDQELGRGSWAAVTKATFRGCPVAVKQIHNLIVSPYNVRLFQREMTIASHCRHPCLLQFIGATNNEKPLIVTELLDTSLRAVLLERALDKQEAVAIALDVARGLNYLHLNNPPIIHRDVSSGNILLWQHGSSYRGKVSDYGTANFMMACTTVAPGCPAYSAPEAVNRNKPSVKLDVYSYGVLLCEMFIREQPFPEEREQQVSMVTDDDIVGLIRACLKQSPTERPCMKEIIGELSRVAVEKGFWEL